MAVVYRKLKIALDNVSWVAVTAPFACNGIFLRNTGANAVLLRTDQNDPNTEDSIDVGLSEVIQHITPDVFLGQQSRQRFAAGSVVCYLKAAAGTSTVIQTSIW